MMCAPVEIVFKANFNIVSARQQRNVGSVDVIQGLKSTICTLEF